MSERAQRTIAECRQIAQMVKELVRTRAASSHRPCMKFTSFSAVA